MMDDLRERVAEAIAWSRFAREYPAIMATGQCKAIIPDALDQEDAQAALSATPIEALQQRVERLEVALREVKQWAEAYPREMFEEPDLDAVRTLLTNAGMRGEMDRMHAAWARHLTEGFGKIARAALGDDVG